MVKMVAKPKKIAKVVKMGKKTFKALSAIYKREKAFISDIFAKLPQSAQTKLSVSATPIEDQYITASDNNPKRKKFLEAAKAKSQQQNPKKNAPLSHEELQQRLHAKIALLSRERVENGQSKKAVRRKLKRTEKDKAKADGKKKLISQKFVSAPSAAAQAGASDSEKTPLQKKPVKRTDGEIVYSKFDFIANDANQQLTIGKPKDKTNKPDDLLKSIEKNKSKLERLEKQGKTSEAVTMVDKQKWNNALQRAKGTKVKDDPALLRKSIKKQDKIKKVKQKKWAERVEHQEKQKEQKQTKRLDNIKARKDEKVKKSKKVLRKRGRIA